MSLLFWITSASAILFLLVLLGILFWFIKRLVNDLSSATEDVEEILVSLKQFSSHINSIHELPMFYGEPVLGSLIKHSKEFVEEVEAFVEKYSYSAPDDEEELEDDEESED